MSRKLETGDTAVLVVDCIDNKLQELIVVNVEPAQPSRGLIDISVDTYRWLQISDDLILGFNEMDCARVNY